MGQVIETTTLDVETSLQQVKKSTATALAGSVITKLFAEIDKLARGTNNDRAWVESLLEVIRFSQDIEVGFGHAKADVLALIKDSWDNLPLDVRKEYGFAFMNFARLFTGKERSTIDNYVNTARIWFIDKARPPGQIRIPQRDPEGRILKDGNNKQYHWVEFDPRMVEMSKLLLVNSRATKGEVTERIWELLVDPFVSCEELRLFLASEISKDEPDFYYISLGPGVFVRANGEVVCIAESLNWDEYETNALVKQGIDRLLKALDIRLDEDFIYDQFKKVHAE